MQFISYLCAFIFYASVGYSDYVYTIIDFPNTRLALSHDDAATVKAYAKQKMPHGLPQTESATQWDKVIDEFSRSLHIIKSNSDDLIEDWVDISKSYSFDMLTEKSSKGQKTVKVKKTDQELQESEYAKNQLVRTITEVGHRFCHQEMCGLVPCKFAADWKCRKEANGDLSFISLGCSARIEDALFAIEPNEITLRVLGALEKQEPEKQPSSIDNTSYYSWLSSYVPSWNLTTTYLTNIAKSTGHAVYEDVINQPIANALDPTRIMKTAGQAMLAAGVLNGYHAATGTINEFDWSTIPAMAKQHLTRGKGVFTATQVARIDSWIAEAEKRLRSYNVKKSEETEKLSQAATDKKISIKQLVDRTQEAAKAIIVTETMLKEREDFELLNLLSALQDFLLLPYEIAYSHHTEVDARIKDRPAYGGGSFKKALAERAHMIAKNAVLEPGAQNKKVIISASGPGTGKTFGFKRMADWAGVPICILRAEDVKKWNFKKSKMTPFQMISQWVARCIKHEFRVDGKRVVNGLILFDDFHYSFSSDGILGTDKESRSNFFSTFIKNGGDSTTESIVSVDNKDDSPWPAGLERGMPLNTSRIQFLVTLNEVPLELNSKTGDQPTIDRTVSIPGAYLSAEERRAFAQDILNGPHGLLAEITERVGRIEARKLNLKVCEAYLDKLAEEDIRIAFTDFNGKFGFRGLLELLDQYKAHVFGKISVPLNPDVCSFDGKVPFVPTQAIAAIESYHGSINQKMKENETNNEISLLAKQLRISMEHAPLSPLARVTCDTRLSIVENTAFTESARRDAYQYVQALVDESRNIIELPHKEAMSPLTVSHFGYLQANDSHEVDRFRPMVSIIQDIHQRLSNQRRGNFQGANRIIRIGYTDPDVLDPRLGDKIAKTLGGLPVLNITKGQLIASRQVKTNKWRLILDPKVSEKLIKVDKSRHLLSNIPNNGRSIESRGTAVFTRGLPAYFGIYLDDLEDRPFYVLLPEKLPLLLNAIEQDSRWEYSWFELLANPTKSARTNFEALITEYFTPRIEMSLWNTINERLQGMRSNAESLIGITLNYDVLNALVMWHKNTFSFSLNDDARTEALLAFLNYLQENLNDPTGITTAKTPVLDGRRLSIILSAPGEKTKEMLLNPAFDEKLERRNRPIDLILGPPPIEGRSIQARSILLGAMAELASTLREEYNEAAADLEINEDEEAMLMALIEYDKTIATYARKHGLITPIQLLDRAVSTITALITERISNYFLFDHKKASLESMKAAWVEIYKAHYEEIKAAKQSKKLRELAAAEANISRMENYNLVKGEDKITQMQTLSGGEYF